MKLAILINRAGPATAPLFKKLASAHNLDLMVYFCSDFGAGRADFDSDFGQNIDWGKGLLEGYKYKISKNLAIVRQLRKNRPNALIVFGWNHYKFWLAYITAILFKIPFFIWSENPLNQELLKKGLAQKIKKLILSGLFKRAKGFLYIGEQNKNFYKHYGISDEKLFFTPYAVDNDYFMEAGKALRVERDKFREEFSIEKEDVVILFVGSFIKKKRPLDLIKAYQKMTNDKFPMTNIHLFFVGDGQLRPELEKYVKEYNLQNVVLAGFKNQNEITKYYALADIFVLPSGAGETWGLVANEAMCFGLPIIASDLVGCTKDLVRHGENGYVFQCENISQLAGFLKDVIQNPSSLKVLGNKSLEIIKNYSYKEDIEGIERALEYVRN